MKTKKVFIFASSLALLSSLISCGPQHTHTYKLVDEVSPNCVETGVEAHYKCEECNKIFDMTKKEISSPVVIDKDPNTHKETKYLSVESGYKNAYKVNESLDYDNIFLRWKCDSCDGVRLNNSERENVTVTYPSEGANKFTSEDAKKASVKVTFRVNSYTTELTVHVNKNDNQITGLTNLDGHCGYKITALDDLIEDGTISSTSGGNIILSISDTEDGTYKKRSEFADDYTFNVRSGETSSSYFIKAEVKADDEYLSASAGPVRLNITHNDFVWDNSRNDYDFVGCLCDLENITKFNKLATNTTDILLSEESATLDLTGSSYNVGPFADSKIESISLTTSTGDVIDLGKSLTIPTTSLKENEIYGDQFVDVKVSHTKISDKVPAGEHIIKVPVHIVTAKITSGTDFRTYCTPNATGQTIRGYYELTNDITISGETTYFKGWDQSSFSGILDGKNHKITCGQSN